MIKIGDTLVSDEIVDEQFVCDLVKCKGGCCVDGDAGAPLEDEELHKLKAFYPHVVSYLSKESVAAIEQNGLFSYDKEFGWVTTVVSSGMCVFGLKGKNGIVKCGIEKAWNDGKTEWQKPISCHLFPIKVTKSKSGRGEYINYEPRQDLCKAGCKLGAKLKVPVYVFLKDALIRKFGAEFYTALVATAKKVFGK